MNLEEWTSGAGSPETKPWLTPVVYSLEAKTLNIETITAQDINLGGRLTQEGGRTTPFGVWASTAEFKTNATTPTFALGPAVGAPGIPSTSLYAGNTYRVKLGGTWTTVGGDTMTINIADLAGTFVYATATILTGGPVTDEPWAAEFEIQIQNLGGAGVGRQASSGLTSRKTPGGASAASVVFTADSLNTTTFNSTGGIYLAPYIGVGLATSTVNRRVGYCTSLY